MITFCAREGGLHQPRFGFIVQSMSIAIYTLNRKQQGGITLFLGTEKLNELSGSCWRLLLELRFGARLMPDRFSFFKVHIITFICLHLLGQNFSQVM